MSTSTTPTFADLKEEALQLRREKRYAEALPLFQRLWSSHRELCSAWEGWGYALALRQCGRTAEALDICREVYRARPDFGPNRQLYAWCIYDTVLRQPQEGDPERVLHAGRAIIELCKQADEHAPYTLAVLRVMRYLLRRPLPQPEVCLTWSELLEESLLPADGKTVSKKDGSTLELPGFREQYCALRIKALFLAEQYDACIESCEGALEHFPAPHHENGIWWRRYAALSKARLGHTEAALALYRELLPRKRSWFIQHEMAELCAAAGDRKQALTLGLQAALNYGEPRHKVNLYRQLAHWLLEEGHPEEAGRHVSLAAAIREENGWQPDPGLEELRLRNLEGFVDVDGSENVPTDLPALLHRLRQEWIERLFAIAEVQHGMLHDLLPHGRAGFIERPDGRRFYFAVSCFYGKPGDLRKGMPLAFITGPGYDPRKQCVVETAFHLRPRHVYETPEVEDISLD